MKEQKITAYTDYNEWTKCRYTTDFVILDNDEIKEIAQEHSLFEVSLDVEQGRDEVYDYDYYKYDYEDEDGDVCTRYVAMKQKSYESTLAEVIDREARYYESYFNYYISACDLDSAMNKLAFDEHFFASDEWEDITNSLSDENLDSLRLCDSDDRSIIIEQLEKFISEITAKCCVEAKKEVNEYYNF